jgi:transcriptional regulator with XRE-family HTH domain
MCNLLTGRQLRAARVLAGLTQKTLGAALGVDQRAVRFWEAKENRRPTSSHHLLRVEQVLLAHGVRLLSDPAPGAMLVQ